MRKRSKARFANGIVSAVIVVFFLVHGALGSLAPFTGFTSPFTWLVWGGVALVGVHVVLSAVTSYQQLTDAQRPPSARKKRHLALKWATGALLAAAAIAHIVVVRTMGAQAMQAHVSAALVIAVLATVLAVHMCVGSKSLLKDLGINMRYQTPFRVVVCVLAAAFAVGALVVVLL